MRVCEVWQFCAAIWRGRAGQGWSLPVRLMVVSYFLPFASLQLSGKIFLRFVEVFAGTHQGLLSVEDGLDHGFLLG